MPSISNLRGYVGGWLEHPHFLTNDYRPPDVRFPIFASGCGALAWIHIQDFCCATVTLDHRRCGPFQNGFDVAPGHFLQSIAYILGFQWQRLNLHAVYQKPRRDAVLL